MPINDTIAPPTKPNHGKKQQAIIALKSII
jgi:hypothetical protein